VGVRDGGELPNCAAVVEGAVKVERMREGIVTKAVEGAADGDERP
jgi:hypothetical protein